MCTNQSIVHPVGYGVSPLLFPSPPVPSGAAGKSCCWFTLRSRQTRFPTTWTIKKETELISTPPVRCNTHWKLNYIKKKYIQMEKVHSEDFIVSVSIFKIVLAILLTKYLDRLSPNTLQTTVIIFTLRYHYIPLGGAMSHTSVSH